MEYDVVLIKIIASQLVWKKSAQLIHSFLGYSRTK